MLAAIVSSDDAVVMFVPFSELFLPGVKCSAPAAKNSFDVL